MSVVSPPDAAAPPPPPRPLGILFENAEMLVVNKPADIPMDGDRVVYPHTVESMVEAHMRQRGIFNDRHDELQRLGKRKKQLKFVHQLDYSTSGVLCLAFTKDMAARLAHCFEMRTTRKYYVALLHGHLPGEKDVVPATAAEEEKGGTELKLTAPFQTWVTQCRQLWKDVGTVQVDSCAAFSAEKNEAALDEFRYLLQTSSTTGPEETEDSAARNPAGVVHRHRQEADGGDSQRGCDIPELIASACASKDACSLTVSLPIGYDAADPNKFRMAVTTEQSRHASTSLLILRRTHLREKASSAPTPVMLVLLSPHTGRRHQLRVHCRALGFPIVGDTAYCAELPWCRVEGPKEWSCGTTARRMYLHAWRLVLPGAVTTHVSEQERVAQKKKRRRETLGLSDQASAAVSADEETRTEFVAPVDFPDLVLDD